MNFFLIGLVVYAIAKFAGVPEPLGSLIAVGAAAVEAGV